MGREGIYVEIPIHANMDELWEKTQNPELHQRWDLRFSQIEYLPRQADELQKFLYRTRVGFGLKIDGQGESVGERDGDGGARTSSLKFWSEDPKSLIKTGSGYWKYVPDSGAEPAGKGPLTALGAARPYVDRGGADDRGHHIRFFTWYDYEIRFGIFGKLIDRWVFRPLLGWATAWSFDRLRLWIEKGIPPEESGHRAIVYALARGTTAFIWFYHGLVPKLLYHDRAELDLISRIGTAPQHLHAAATLAGVVEVLFAFLLIIFWRRSWLLWLTLVLMLVGIPVVAVTAPEYLSAAFNPVTLNTSLAVFAAIALITGRDLPTAANCRRKPEHSA
jgi:DoxX-like family